MKTQKNKTETTTEQPTKSLLSTSLLYKANI